jgi:hypothetical protein
MNTLSLPVSLEVTGWANATPTAGAGTRAAPSCRPRPYSSIDIRAIFAENIGL